MLHEKRKDLDVEKQKKLLLRLVNELTQSRPDLYYQATGEIARHIEDYIAHGAVLHGEERELLERLTVRDIEVLLSLH